MTLAQLAYAHPGWTLLFMIVLASCIPTITWRVRK